jgi:hypothetical protein
VHHARMEVFLTICLGIAAFAEVRSDSIQFVFLLIMSRADRSLRSFCRSRCPKKPTQTVSEPSTDSAHHITESPSLQTLLGMRMSFVPF